MAQLSYHQAAVAGTAIAFSAATVSGDTVPDNPNGGVLVKNDDVSAKTVTVVVPGNTRFGQAEPDVAVTVAAGETRLIGPLPSELADPTDGLVHLTYSAVTSLSVAAVSI